MEAYLGRQGARCDVVRAAEGGEEVIESVLVGDVDACETEAPFVFIAIEEIVLADRGVEEAALLNAWRVLVVVLSTRSRNRHKVGGQLRSQALPPGYPCKGRRLDAITG